MSITLPTSPGAADLTARLIDFGGEISSALGAGAVRVNRLGNRWAFDVRTPPLAGAQARAWCAALASARTAGALFALTQPGLDVGSPGTPLVKGAGQTGSVLVIDGLASSYGLRAGQWISLISGGRRYVHQVAADVTAVSGEASVPITPMLRVSPADNATVEVAAPMVEGFLGGAEVSWTVDAAGHAGLGFTITEAA